jgi:hypothetical protein
VKPYYEHWYGIGWPEDEKPIALLERAMELLRPTPTTEERGPAKDITGCDV